MDCTLICLLASSIGFHQPPDDIKQCNYCVDIRIIDDICEIDPLQCVRQMPSSILYCLTVDEVAEWSQVDRQMRCLSHADFPIPNDTIRHVYQSGACMNRRMRNCNCSTCLKQKVYSSTSTTEEAVQSTTLALSTAVTTSTSSSPITLLARFGLKGKDSRSLYEKPTMKPALSNSGQHSAVIAQQFGSVPIAFSLAILLFT